MNNVKMSRRFICSVAMPLALMFAACSDDKSVAGGSAEETGVYALKDITVAARAYYARTLEIDGGSGGVAVSAPSNLFMYGGEARLSELDTVTLEPLDSVAITANICTTEPDTLTGEVTNPCDEGDRSSLKTSR